MILAAKTAVVEVRVGRMVEGILGNTHERPFGLVITVYIWNEKQNSNKGVPVWTLNGRCGEVFDL